jgi:hypothetical protein
VIHLLRRRISPGEQKVPIFTLDQPLGSRYVFLDPGCKLVYCIISPESIQLGQEKPYEQPLRKYLWGFRPSEAEKHKWWYYDDGASIDISEFCLDFTFLQILKPSHTVKCEGDWSAEHKVKLNKALNDMFSR